jgi:hypothetical protein
LVLFVHAHDHSFHSWTSITQAHSLFSLARICINIVYLLNPISFHVNHKTREKNFDLIIMYELNSGVIKKPRTKWGFSSENLLSKIYKICIIASNSRMAFNLVLGYICSILFCLWCIVCMFHLYFSCWDFGLNFPLHMNIKQEDLKNTVNLDKPKSCINRTLKNKVSM